MFTNLQPVTQYIMSLSSNQAALDVVRLVVMVLAIVLLASQIINAIKLNRDQTAIQTLTLLNKANTIMHDSLRILAIKNSAINAQVEAVEALSSCAHIYHEILTKNKAMKKGKKPVVDN